MVWGELRKDSQRTPEMTSPNDATIHDLEQAVASLKLAQKPLDADDLLREGAVSMARKAARR